MKRLPWFFLGFVLLIGACRLPVLGGASPSYNFRQVQVKTPQVYYGSAACGANAAIVEIALEPNASEPAQVGVQYRLAGAQTANWQHVAATRTGPATYLAVVPIPPEAANVFQNQAGTVEYRAFATDAQGNTAYAPDQGTYTLTVQPCAQAAAAGGQDTVAPTIQQVLNSSAMVYYAGACQPNTLTLTAIVIDNSGQLQKVEVEYWLEREGRPVSQPYRQAMQGQGSVYQLALRPGAETAQALQNQPGALGYRILATDAAGNTATYPSGAAKGARVTLQPCQAHAANPSTNPAGNTRPKPPTTSANTGAKPPSGSQKPGGQPPSAPPANKPPTPSGNAKPPAQPPASNASLAIRNVLTDPADQAYYGACPAGTRTWVDITVQVSDIQKVAAAKVRYRYERATQSGQATTRTVTMGREQGIGDYTARIDVAADLQSETADWLVYEVEITTTDGQTVTSPAYFLPLQACASQPPPAPVEPRIIGAAINPDRPRVGNACPAGSTVVTFDVVVEPPENIAEVRADVGYAPVPNTPQYLTSVPLTSAGGSTFRGQIDLNDLFTAPPPEGVPLVVTFVLRSTSGAESQTDPQYLELTPCVASTPPTIVYFVAQPDVVSAGDGYTLEWEVRDATCGVYLDGELVEASGSKSFTTTNDVDRITHVLNAYSGACDAPLSASETVSVEVRTTSNTFHKGSIQMYADDTLDLDQDGTLDLSLVDEGSSWAFVPWGQTEFIPLEATAIVSEMSANYEECVARFLYEPDAAVYGVNVEPGLGFCVRTAAGKIGYIEVTQVDPDQGLISIAFYAETVP